MLLYQGALRWDSPRGDSIMREQLFDLGKGLAVQSGSTTAAMAPGQ